LGQFAFLEAQKLPKYCWAPPKWLAWRFLDLACSTLMELGNEFVGGFPSFVDSFSSHRIASLGQKCGATELVSVAEAIQQEVETMLGGARLDLVQFPTLQLKFHLALTYNAMLAPPSVVCGLVKVGHQGLYALADSTSMLAGELDRPAGVLLTGHPVYSTLQLRSRAATPATPFTSNAAMSLTRVGSLLFTFGSLLG